MKGKILLAVFAVVLVLGLAFQAGAWKQDHSTVKPSPAPSGTHSPWVVVPTCATTEKVPCGEVDSTGQWFLVTSTNPVQMRKMTKISEETDRTGAILSVTLAY